MKRAITFMETTSMIKDASKKEEYFTVSSWVLKDDFKDFECVFQIKKY